MQTRVTLEEIQAAARQLAKSDSGRASMQQLAELLRNDHARHGLLERAALATLLQGAWDGHSAEVRDAIKDAMSETEPSNASRG